MSIACVASCRMDTGGLCAGLGSAGGRWGFFGGRGLRRFGAGRSGIYHLHHVHMISTGRNCECVLNKALSQSQHGPILATYRGPTLRRRKPPRIQGFRRCMFNYLIDPRAIPGLLATTDLRVLLSRSSPTSLHYPVTQPPPLCPNKLAKKGRNKPNDSYSEKDRGVRESEDQHDEDLRETTLQPPTPCSLATKESKRNTIDAHS